MEKILSILGNKVTKIILLVLLGLGTLTGGYQALGARTGPSKLKALSDVNIDTPLADQTLVYNATTTKWINSTSTSGGGGITDGTVIGTFTGWDGSAWTPITSTTIFASSTTGYIGIGTNNPGTPLEVLGEFGDVSLSNTLSVEYNSTVGMSAGNFAAGVSTKFVGNASDANGSYFTFYGTKAFDKDGGNITGSLMADVSQLNGGDQLDKTVTAVNDRIVVAPMSIAWPTSGTLTNGGNAYLFGGAGLNGGTEGNIILAYDVDNSTALGKVGIGTDSPENTLTVVNEDAIYPRGISSEEYTNGDASAIIIQQKARGTVASPLPVQDGDYIASLIYRAWDGSKFWTPASIVALITDTVSVGSVPTSLLFNTSATDDTGGLERMRITSDGNVGIGTSTPRSRLDLGYFYFPDTDGTNGQVLATNGSDVLTWTTAGGGIFANTGTTTSNENGVYATDDFVFGSGQLTDDGNTDHEERMFFDKSKGAIRAGRAQGNRWDDANVGLYSVAFGFNGRAIGSSSAVLSGYDNQADEDYSIIVGGRQNSITGTGEYGVIGGGYQNNVDGLHSVVGGGNDNNATGDYSTIPGGHDMTVSGDYSFGINLDSSTAQKTLAQDNTMAIMGGKVGIGTLTPAYDLQVAGGTTTSTMSVGVSGVKAGCLPIQDTDLGGWSYCTVLDGTMTCSSVSCL